MRFIFVVMFALFFSPAHAQYGTGLGGAGPWGGGMYPASGSMNGMDQQANLNGRMNYNGNMIDQKKQYLAGMDEQVSRARTRMRAVLNDRVIRAIEEHFRFQRKRADYKNCNFNSPAQPDYTAQVNLPGQAHGGVGGGGAMVPPPPEFCFRGSGQSAPRNTWWDFAEDGGRVSDIICDYHIPGFVGHPSQSQSSTCKDGLSEYYQILGSKLQMENEIAQLDNQRRAMERGVVGVNGQMAEGTYCPYCAAQRAGYAQVGAMDSFLPMLGMLAMVGISMVNRMDNPMMGPGGGAFLGRPYPGMIPGYMGMYNGMYGAVPGGMGMGAFGVGGMGVNPYAMGNPYGMAAMGAPYMNGGASPWLNPYAAANPMMNPSMMNSMFMPGYGPGYGPMLGNGINGYNSYMPYSSFNSPMMGMGGYGNGYNPTMMGMNGGMSPYFQNPYQMGYGGMLGPPRLPFLGYGSSSGNMGMGSYGSPYGLGLSSPYSGSYGMNSYGNMGMGYNPYAMGTGMNMGYSPYGNSYGLGLNPTLGGGYGYNPYGSYGGSYSSPYGLGFSGGGYPSFGGVGYGSYSGGVSGPPVLPFPGPGTYSNPSYNSFQSPNIFQSR